MLVSTTPGNGEAVSELNSGENGSNGASEPNPASGIGPNAAAAMTEDMETSPLNADTSAPSSSAGVPAPAVGQEPATAGPSSSQTVSTGDSPATNDAVARPFEVSPASATTAMTSPIALGGVSTPAIEIKLFVGRVPRSMDEDQLRPIFEEFGTVTEMAIIRDRGTGQHKGSAFVRMGSITQADAAIRALDGSRVLDASLGAVQVRYATGEAEKLGMNTEAAPPGQDQAKLFVGSLPRTVTEDEVKTLFAPYGQVLEVFVMKDPQSGQGKGCAFVKFAYKEQAINAIRVSNGQLTVNGAPRPLEVRFAESKTARVQQQVQHQQNMGMVPGAVYGQTNPNGMLSGMLGGTVASAGLMGVAGGQVLGHLGGGMAGGVMGQCSGGLPASNLNPRCAGAWKEYFTDDGRAYYHNETTGLTQWEKPAEFDKTDVTGPLGANIFIFHVPNEWSHTDLMQAFGSFGQILSARIATDKATGRNKGYAFVSYAAVSGAAQAVQHMNGFMAGQKRLKVSIKQGEEQYAQMYLSQASGVGGGSPVGAGPPMLGGVPGGMQQPQQTPPGSSAASGVHMSGGYRRMAGGPPPQAMLGSPPHQQQLMAQQHAAMSAGAGTGPLHMMGAPQVGPAAAAAYGTGYGGGPMTGGHMGVGAAGAHQIHR